MVDDIIVHKQKSTFGNGARYHPYRENSVYGFGASSSYNNLSGDGKGDGEGYFTQGNGSGRGNGYSYGRGYNHGEGYGNYGNGYGAYNGYLLDRVSTSPAQWADLGLMPQRSDNAILVWKNVSWDGKRHAWVGGSGWLYRVGQPYVCRWARAQASPIQAIHPKYYGNTVPHVMAIWAHQLTAYQGGKDTYLAQEGTPAAVYAAPDYIFPNSECALFRVESDGGPDPLTMVTKEQQPFFSAQSNAAF